MRVQYTVLVPMTDDEGRAREASASDGKTYPIFQVAEDSPLVEHVNEALGTTFAYEVLNLERYARNLLMWELAIKGYQNAEQYELLAEPMYLLLSREEGGFARHGFWLQDELGKQRLVLTNYVDLVVNEDDLKSGDFEETFSHELGHIILRVLLGSINGGPSRKMHMSMTVTDYPTAFDEGYAIHFQPLVRDATKNPNLIKLVQGTTPTDLFMMWHSNLDQQLRTDGVKRNLFIYRKAIPTSALGSIPDLYQVYLDGETSTAFLTDQLKNAQQMLACEGVIATLFYRIVNNEHLRNCYCEPQFYNRFLPDEQITNEPERYFNPYENINLKLFVAVRETGRKGTDRSRPLMIEMVDTYRRLFPEEAKMLYDVFLKTTRGATVSQEASNTFGRLAYLGRTGDIMRFQQLMPASFQLLGNLLSSIMDGRMRLDSNLGPELWIMNTGFKIAGAIWQRERDTPLSINLNTATEAELMTMKGIDLNLARGIVTARQAVGFFHSIDDLQKVEGVSNTLLKSLRDMSKHMKHAETFQRE